MGNIVRLRDVDTGEFKDFDDAEQEFRDAKRERDKSGRKPRWEQTGDHHVARTKERAAEGVLAEEDLGKDFQPLPRPVGDHTVYAPEQNPNLELSPAEVEMGLTKEQKEEELRSQFASEEGQEETSIEQRNRLLDEASEKINPDAGKQRGGARGRGQRGRAQKQPATAGEQQQGQGG